MEKRGGYRENAGRKSKDEEQTLIKKLSPLEDLAHSKLLEAIEDGKDWAIKMYFEYMYGKPKQQTDITTAGEKINQSIQVEIVRNED
jgi:hypothetical protein